MAANEPKITKLKPGEGAGNFKPKQGPGKLQNKPGQENRESMRSRTPKGQRRTQNPAILSDGSVDPRSGQYQRSVAGREKLEDYVKRLDGQGVEEKDIFMAAVKSLKNRGHGYVGAYLDSKNPNRRYNDAQASAIADAVMSKAGVGDHPGARLTKEDSDTKETRGDKRAAAKESGSTPEPGRKAMPIRQQRKEPGGRGERSLGMPETWAKADKGVELNTPEARERERTGWKDFDPAKSDLQRPEKSGPTRKEVAIKKEEEAREKGTSVAPTAAQKFQKSLKEKPEPTADQRLQIDELMDKREEMDPEEWEKAFTQLMDDVKNGIGGQREELRKYIQNIKGKGGKVPLPGSAAAASRDEKIKENQAAKEEQQKLRQTQAQAGREEAKKRRQAQKEAEEERRIEEEIPIDEEGTPEEKPAGLQVTDDLIDQKFKENYQRAYKSFLEKAQKDARRNRQITPKSIKLTPKQFNAIATDVGDDLEDEGYNVDRRQIVDVINKKFGLNIPAPEQEEEAQGPKTTTEQPEPATEQPLASQPQLPASPEEAPPQEPKRQPLLEERLGQGRKRQTVKPAKGFSKSPDYQKTKSEIKDTVQEAVSQGMTPEQVIESFKQGTLFPGGLATETSQTNPLEGGSTAPPAEGPEPRPGAQAGGREPATAGRGQPGQQSIFKKGTTEPRSDLQAGTRKTTKPVAEKTRQIPLRLPGVSSQTLQGRADAEQRRIARETRALGKPPAAPKRRGKAPQQPNLFTPTGRPRRFNTSEMSYDEFSQTVRSLMR